MQQWPELGVLEGGGWLGFHFHDLHITPFQGGSHFGLKITSKFWALTFRLSPSFHIFSQSLGLADRDVEGWWFTFRVWRF